MSERTPETKDLLDRLEKLDTVAERRAEDRKRLKVIELKQQLWDALERDNIERARQCLEDWKTLEPDNREHIHYDRIIGNHVRIIELRSELADALERGKPDEAGRYLEEWRELKPHDDMLWAYKWRIEGVRKRLAEEKEEGEPPREKEKTLEGEKAAPTLEGPVSERDWGRSMEAWQPLAVLLSLVLAASALLLSCVSLVRPLRATPLGPPATETSFMDVTSAPSPTITLTPGPAVTIAPTSTPTQTEEPSPAPPMPNLDAIEWSLQVVPGAGIRVGEYVTFTAVITARAPVTMSNHFGVELLTDDNALRPIPLGIGERGQLVLEVGDVVAGSVASTLNRHLPGTYSASLIYRHVDDIVHMPGRGDPLTIDLDTVPTDDPDEVNKFYDGALVSFAEPLPEEVAAGDTVTFTIRLDGSWGVAPWKPRLHVLALNVKDASLHDFGMTFGEEEIDAGGNITSVTFQSGGKIPPAGDYEAWIVYDYLFHDPDKLGQYFARVRGIEREWEEIGFTVSQ